MADRTVEKPAWPKTWARPELASLLLFMVLNVLLYWTGGQNFGTPSVVWILTVAVAAYLWALSCQPAEPTTTPLSLKTILSVFLLCSLALRARDDHLLYPLAGTALRTIRVLEDLAWAVSAAALLALWRQYKLRTQIGLLASLGLILVLSEILVLWASPAPHIDVFTSATHAVRFLLDGVNPYSQVYPDIYAGEFDYAPGYAYWPGALLASTLGYAVFGDIRAMFVVCDLAAGVGLTLWCNKRTDDPVLSMLVGLTWLSFATTLFVLEQAWIDPLLLPGLLFTMWALERKRMLWVGVGLGYLLTVKQYGLLPSLTLFPAVLHRNRWRDLGLVILGGLIPLTVWVLPFALWDTEGFIRMTITVPLRLAYRPDSLSLPGLLLSWKAIKVPSSAILFTNLVTLGLLGRFMFRRGPCPTAWLQATAAAYAVVFLTGKQAFCNYYWWLAFVLLAAAISRGSTRATHQIFAKTSET